ncbi:MAG: tyrosine-type recombinase/integrase [Bacteroidales bacterium]|nr:tyrosine-type recombinase/integrase [Bacteroidales bacterium]
MNLIDDYIDYIRGVRRYSERTSSIYEDVLNDYLAYVSREFPVTSDAGFAEAFNVSEIRGYVVHMLDDRNMSEKSVNLHLSSLSGFCRYLMKRGFLKSNPVRLVTKPKNEKRLPKFYRNEAMEDYFKFSSHVLEEEYEVFLAEWNTKSGKDAYSRIVERVVISALYSLGVRRSELIVMCIGDVDFGRKVVKVHGKGDKMREIPLVESLSEEFLLYLKAVEVMCGRKRSLTEPLFVTYSGSPLYPKYVDRVVKSALGGVGSIRGQKSPHVLRHSLATELMNREADLNSIKELLGHSSLAATQVYTHSSITRLKDIYERAHPRAKNGGKHGD